jgi:deoxyribodipyrimidine photo-lyase
VSWTPTRAAGLARLAAFVPSAGSTYQRLRNHDFGPDDRRNVSLLSPWLRHRLVLETEVLDAVLGRFAPSTAEKFVQEVYWRSYWKGWLEQHPDAWWDYRSTVDADLARMGRDDDLALRYQAAVTGETGIEPFDLWLEELTDSGYLHNHARMWFASIWIFTLDLPWTLGADLFLRHLLDGDPASNTLSWRWVAGLHTPGKHYVARPDNVARYAARRLTGAGAPGLERLNTAAEPLEEAARPPKITPHWPAVRPAPSGRVGVLLGEDDLHLDVPGRPLAVATLPPARRSPLDTAAVPLAFTCGALDDAAARAATAFELGEPARPLERVAAVAAWARDAGLDQVLMAYAPVGPGAEAQVEASRVLAGHGIELVTFLRSHDANAWPHADRGYFRLKKRIPELLAARGR